MRNMSSRRPYRPAKRKSTVSLSVNCTATKRNKSEPVIHSLPEGIICDIVSRLTLKDAVRTSLVSKNWRRLWTCHPNLCFDSPTILNREPGSSSGSRRHMFIKRVNAALKSRGGSIGLRRFRIAFALDGRHAKHLDRWLGFALDSRASDIAINLLPVLRKNRTYTLPFHVFSSQDASYMESLRLVGVSLKSPHHDFDGFVNLTVLDLQSVYMLDDLELLLSKCNALECLRLARCYRMFNLKVKQPLGRLRYLSVQECRQQGMEFNAPNLVNFEYSGETIVPITLGESVKVTEATVTLTKYVDTLEHVFTELPKTLSRVETLFVDTCINTQVVGFSKCLMKFTHLIKLEVTVTILGNSRNRKWILRLASLLKVAPLLQRLELNMLPAASVRFISEPEAHWQVKPCTHRHLEQVMISGFIGLKGQLELVLYILDNAVALRRLSIEPRVTAYVFEQWAGSDPDIRRGRECALKNLLPEDYPDVQIEIL